MPPPPAISDAEWEVMNVLWARAPLGANEVIAGLAGRKTWNPRTVKTLLNRLVKKGALGYEAVGKAYLYWPRVSRDQCVRAESRSFLARVFGGAVGPMLIRFVAEAKLTPQEIEHLKTLLKHKEK